MIRIILYRIDGTGEWTEGCLHGFQQDKAVVENLKTGELCLVPVTPETLKFKILTTEWVEMQVKAQQEAQARQVVASPNISFGRGR
jgi:hypothetical protein